jgi:IS30 family transposase
MEYPNLSDSLDRRKKLTLDDIKTIHTLYERGFSQSYIAKQVGVCQRTISYHVSIEVNKRDRERASARVKEKWKTDKAFKEKHREKRRDSRHYVETVSEPHRTYYRLNK